ncbi:unnamed protein product [Sphenostylis stenocarpa]|uniref:Uncharacterized protein n=1 Tax=Sphenostylis stenocarpa TaxID=92480 RepID=A0AA86SKR5_9FABA|nr:unnamed protein product [Sphenostylis stenocarpa]
MGKESRNKHVMVHKCLVNRQIDECYPLGLDDEDDDGVGLEQLCLVASKKTRKGRLERKDHFLFLVNSNLNFE